MLKKSRRAGDDRQVTHSDVQPSVLSDVPTAAPATLLSIVASTDQVTSFMHPLAVGPDTVSIREQASSTESEETDQKSAAQMATCFSVGYSASLCASPFSVPASVFGVQEWRRYLGEVGEAPCLPSDIDEILNSACPFWPGRQVKDTHLLVLIPATVNSQVLSFNLLGELIRSPRGGGYSTAYNYYDSDVQEQLGARSPESSYWVLLTRDVLEGSRGEDYASQKDLVAQHASRTGLSYGLPGALEAATAILSHYVRSGEFLYTDDPGTWTRCQELVAYRGGDYPVAVGSFSSRGLDIFYDDLVFPYCGVASLRKL